MFINASMKSNLIGPWFVLIKDALHYLIIHLMDRPLYLIFLILGRVNGYTHAAGQVPTLTESIRIVRLKGTRCCIETGLHLNSQ